MAAAKTPILISRCLLGVPCRYHGQTHRRGRRIGRPALVKRLRRKHVLIPICPEVDAGMPTPRPPTRIVNGRWLCNGEDVTATFERGAKQSLELGQSLGCKKAYLLKYSPACDKDCGATGKCLMANNIAVIPV